MGNALPAQEPSMDEILASIRAIIESGDQTPRGGNARSRGSGRPASPGSDGSEASAAPAAPAAPAATERGAAVSIEAGDPPIRIAADNDAPASAEDDPRTVLSEARLRAASLVAEAERPGMEPATPTPVAAVAPPEDGASPAASVPEPEPGAASAELADTPIEARLAHATPEAEPTGAPLGEAPGSGGEVADFFGEFDEEEFAAALLDMAGLDVAEQDAFSAMGASAQGGVSVEPAGPFDPRPETDGGYEAASAAGPEGDGAAPIDPEFGDLDAALLESLDESGVAALDEPSAPLAATADAANAEPEPEAADMATGAGAVADATAEAAPSLEAGDEVAAVPTSEEVKAVVGEPAIAEASGADAHTRTAAADAFGALDPRAVSQTLMSQESGNLVSASFADLAQAVHAEQRATMRETAEDLLRPMLKEWLDENLPHLVERLVREEIQRVARGGR